MNALLLVSQLLVPQLPADVTEDNFIKETIKSFACVKDVEEDGIVHTMNDDTGVETSTARLIVTVKDKKHVAKCAKELTREIEGLTVERTFTIIPAFVVSYEVPASISNDNK